MLPTPGPKPASTEGTLKTGHTAPLPDPAPSRTFHSNQVPQSPSQQKQEWQGTEHRAGLSLSPQLLPAARNYKGQQHPKTRVSGGESPQTPHSYLGRHRRTCCSFLPFPARSWTGRSQTGTCLCPTLLSCSPSPPSQVFPISSPSQGLPQLQDISLSPSPAARGWGCLCPPRWALLCLERGLGAVGH